MKAIYSKLTNFSVTRSFNLPKIVTLTMSSSLNDAIFIIGGAKVLEGAMRFVRFKNDWTIDDRKILYKKSYINVSFNNHPISNKDFIYVGNSILTASNKVMSEFINPFMGLFSKEMLVAIQ